MEKRIKAVEMIKNAENPIDWTYAYLGSFKENEKIVILRIGKKRVKIYVIYEVYWM